MVIDPSWSSLRGPSFPNHLYSVAAASGPDVPHSVIGNPKLPAGQSAPTWGCDSPSTALAPLRNGSSVYPCFSYTTLADEMDAAGVSWKYYAPTSTTDHGYVWSTLDAFSQIRNGPDWTNNVVDDSQMLSDAANGALPSFSWVTPPEIASEHPPESICVGENWTVAMINAIESGPDWNSTLIVLAWDDYGGFYDHARPDNIDALGYGFRVPLMVISPYAFASDHPRAPHVSHVRLDLTSVLAYAEDLFGLARLSTRDAKVDNLAQLLDLSGAHVTAPLILTQRPECQNWTRSNTRTLGASPQAPDD